MNWDELRAAFPEYMLTVDDLVTLVRTGSVAVCVGNRRVFTLRIEAEESDIPELATSWKAQTKLLWKTWPKKE